MDIIPSGEIEKDGALFFLAKMNDAVNGTNLQLQNIRKDMAVRTFIIMASVTNAGKVLDAVIYIDYQRLKSVRIYSTALINSGPLFYGGNEFHTVQIDDTVVMDTLQLWNNSKVN